MLALVLLPSLIGIALAAVCTSSSGKRSSALDSSSDKSLSTTNRVLAVKSSVAVSFGYPTYGKEPSTTTITVAGTSINLHPTGQASGLLPTPSVNVSSTYNWPSFISSYSDVKSFPVFSSSLFTSVSSTTAPSATPPVCGIPTVITNPAISTSPAISTDLAASTVFSTTSLEEIVVTLTLTRTLRITTRSSTPTSVKTSAALTANSTSIQIETSVNGTFTTSYTDLESFPTYGLHSTASCTGTELPSVSTIGATTGPHQNSSQDTSTTFSLSTAQITCALTSAPESTPTPTSPASSNMALSSAVLTPNITTTPSTTISYRTSVTSYQHSDSLSNKPDPTASTYASGVSSSIMGTPPPCYATALGTETSYQALSSLTTLVTFEHTHKNRGNNTQ